MESHFGGWNFLSVVRDVVAFYEAWQRSSLVEGVALAVDVKLTENTVFPLMLLMVKLHVHPYNLHSNFPVTTSGPYQSQSIRTGNT